MNPMTKQFNDYMKTKEYNFVYNIISKYVNRDIANMIIRI